MPHGFVDFLVRLRRFAARRAERMVSHAQLPAGSGWRWSGETDFPCITGDRVGVGRSYVRARPPPDRRRRLRGLGSTPLTRGSCTAAMGAATSWELRSLNRPSSGDRDLEALAGPLEITATVAARLEPGAHAGDGGHPGAAVDAGKLGLAHRAGPHRCWPRGARGTCREWDRGGPRHDRGRRKPQGDSFQGGGGPELVDRAPDPAIRPYAPDLCPSRRQAGPGIQAAAPSGAGPASTRSGR